MNTAQSNSWKRRVLYALASDGLTIAGQPIESRPADGMQRLELLLQLRDGQSAIPAGKWIDAVIDTPELMQRLDRWVMGWLFCIPREGQFWVNCSAHSLEDNNFPWVVGGMLERGTLRPEQVVVEVTEQAQTGVQSLATLKALADFGMGIAIDDFGAGFNSAQKLVDFPCTALKLTGDLCRAVEQPRQGQILEAFIGMGLTMGLDVVVEWVESQAQFELLSNLGAKLFQGWHFGLPRPMQAPRECWLQNLEPIRDQPASPTPAGARSTIRRRAHRSA